MAATNFTPIQLYHSTTASAAPTAGNLANGELAINITDGKLFYKDNGGTVRVLATKGTGTIGGSNNQVQYNSSGALAGSANFTFDGTTATINTLNLTTVLDETYGGTGNTSYATGDLLYASAANTLSKLTVGTNGYILTSNGTIPTWTAGSSISVNTATNLAGGLAGSVPYQSGAGATTFLGIGAANRVLTSSGTAPQWVTSLTGLTGVSSSGLTNTSLTAGRVVYSTTGGAQTDSANLTFDGTTLTAAGLATGGVSTLDKLVKIGDSGFTLPAVLSATAPAKLYVSTATVTDGSSAAGATNTLGTIASLGSTTVAASNTGVTYTNLATLYIAGAPTAGTNVTITNPYSLYVAGGASYFGGGVTYGGNLTVTGNLQVDGNTTLGNASTDTVTVNSAAWTLNYDVTATMAAGTGLITSSASAVVPGTEGNYPLRVGYTGYNGSLAFGVDASYGYIQTFNSKPLYIQPSGNQIHFGDNVLFKGANPRINMNGSATNQVASIVNGNGGSTVIKIASAGIQFANDYETTYTYMDSAGTYMYDTNANAGSVKLLVTNGANGFPVTSGSTQTYGALRLRGGDNAVLDFGVNGGNGSWIQSTDKLSLANFYNLYLNPRGGDIKINTVSTANGFTGLYPKIMALADNTKAIGEFVSGGGGRGLYILSYGAGSVASGSDFYVLESNALSTGTYGAYTSISSMRYRVGTGFYSDTPLYINNGGGSVLVGPPDADLFSGGSVRLIARTATNAWPATSGTTQTAALRLCGADNAVLDMGLNSVNTWIQATDKSGLNNYYYLNLNPRGGYVGINGGTSTPSDTLHVFAATNYGITIAATDNPTFTLIDTGNSTSKIRTVGDNFSFDTYNITGAMRIRGSDGRVTIAGGDSSYGNYLNVRTPSSITTGTQDSYALGVGVGSSNQWTVGTLTGAAVYIQSWSSLPMVFNSQGNAVWFPGSYASTTGSAANCFIDSNGEIKRSTSSLKYKQDIVDAVHGLSEVMQLRPITYKAKPTFSKNDKGEMIANPVSGQVFGGLIAEEVHALGLTEFVQYGPDGDPEGLAYGNMVSLLTKAIQQLKTQFDAYVASHP
jgi:hypothetical protein